MSRELSQLALVMVIARAKELYEILHPETRHGGERAKQDAKKARCPSFADHVAQTRGISCRTVHRRLEQARELATLERDAAAACYGTALSNQIGILVRIAGLSPDFHLEVVRCFGRQRSLGMKALRKLEGKCNSDAGRQPRATEKAGVDEGTRVTAFDSSTLGTHRTILHAERRGIEPELDDTTATDVPDLASKVDKLLLRLQSIAELVAEDDIPRREEVVRATAAIITRCTQVLAVAAGGRPAGGPGG